MMSNFWVAVFGFWTLNLTAFCFSVNEVIEFQDWTHVHKRFVMKGGCCIKYYEFCSEKEFVELKLNYQ